MTIDAGTRFGRALLAIELSEAARHIAQIRVASDGADHETVWCGLRILQARVASLVGRLAPCEVEA